MSTVAVHRASTPNAQTHRLYDYMNELYNKIAQRAFWSSWSLPAE
jgi:hypothetical protein